MPEHSALVSAEEERLELEAVAEAIGRSSRLAHLLHYIGEKYLAGQSNQLSEYIIATEVFGRSKTTFDATEDAIARVEAHRLRKRLKEFYEGPGKEHPLQISIPPGSYAPTFTRKAAEPLSSSSAREAQISAGGSGVTMPAATGHPGQPRRRNWVFAGVILALICVAWISVAVFLRSRATGTPGTSSRNFGGSISASQGSAAGTAKVPVRLLAGYSGTPQTDSAGHIWNADEYVQGGGAWRRPEADIARTSDPLIFEHWRTGDSTYDIPLAPGVYELHLYFVTSERSSESFRTFTVRINGQVVLTGFDINSDALGENIADERIFRDVSPGSDGMLHVSFATERGAPQLNALEVLPGIAHKQLPIRMVMQRTPFTDHNGQFWQPDDYYMNGRLSDQRQEIAGSPDPDLFAMERYGHFTYAIPVDARDRYTLILHFVEFYFGTQASGGSGGTGSRVFRVMCNGETLLDDFDVYKEAGSLHVLTKTFYHLKPSAQGKLNLTFEPIVNNATISGIEVLDESQ